MIKSLKIRKHGELDLRRLGKPPVAGPVGTPRHRHSHRTLLPACPLSLSHRPPLSLPRAPGMRPSRPASALGYWMPGLGAGKRRSPWPLPGKMLQPCPEVPGLVCLLQACWGMRHTCPHSLGGQPLWVEKVSALAKHRAGGVGCREGRGGVPSGPCVRGILGLQS